MQYSLLDPDIGDFLKINKEFIGLIEKFVFFSNLLQSFSFFDIFLNILL